MDGDAVAVVGRQPAVPEHAALGRPHEPLRGRLHDALEVVAVGLLDDRRASLDEHVLGALGKTVVTGVVGQRHARLTAQAVELAPEAE